MAKDLTFDGGGLVFGGMLLTLVQVLYWLALATWFGGVLFVALTAPIIFRTVKENEPRLPDVGSANLDGQHGMLLAGMIVGNILEVVSRMGMMAGAVLALTLVVQWVTLGVGDVRVLVLLVLRSSLWMGAVVLTVYHWLVVWPRIEAHRRDYIEHADVPEIANPAKDQFDRYHKESVTIHAILLFMLLGMILFSGTMAAVRIVAGG